PAPDWAIPPAREHQSPDHQGPPAKLKDRYAAAALADACWKIRHASAGVQEITLYSECKSIGTLAGADGIPTSIALGELLRAARDMPDFDHRRRWRSRELQRKVEHAFADGLRRPRGQRHG